MKRNKIIFFLLLCCAINLSAQQHSYDLPIIPKPSFTTINDGYFVLTSQTKISIVKTNPYFKNDVDLFNDHLKLYYNFSLQEKSSDGSNDNCIVIEESTTIKSPEAYNLSIQKNKITISASPYGSGVFYALQSLTQLLAQSDKNNLKIPCAEIKDQPRFEWRGMHLDVCRHFYPVAFIKKYIDLLALHKMNTFHWHLTEDQGWRIEIKKYPKLTEIGAWRNGTMIGPYSDQTYDSIKYGGYYTQQEIKDIVQYASQRHITIVPEIEMPGHAQAAIASYPWLSCSGKQLEVAKGWGVFEDVFCAKDSTFRFLQDVLDEVINLFPSKYIHIGGDECPKTRWKTCSKCQSIMKQHNLKDEHELQSYFITKIEKYLNSKGKQIIGWDEILEGGLAPNAAVMSWRGTEGGITAAKQKHKVVMSPGSHCYFDHYQASPNDEPLAIGGFTSLEKVYSYEPVPDELSKTEQQYILGAQANVWTEYILNEKHVEYMAYPRACALAEVLWTPKELKNETDFIKRLEHHFTLLDLLNVNYLKTLYQITQTTIPAKDSLGVSVTLNANAYLGDIYYTTNSSEPTIESNKYKEPIAIQKNTILKASLIKDGIIKGKVSTKDYSINLATGKRVSLSIPASSSYNYRGWFTLVDGIIASKKRNNQEWLGWSGKNPEITVDLKESVMVEKITISFLKEELNWIYLPASIEFLVSEDGRNFKSIGILNSNQIESERFATINIKPKNYRYIKISLTHFGKIPSGKPGSGMDSWLFCDEIQVN